MLATKNEKRKKERVSGIASEKMAQGGPFPCIFLAKTTMRKRRKNKNAMLK
jgi:hypothetical protein